MSLHIHIESTHFYDDELHPNPEAITEDDKLSGRVKLGHDGKWRRKATFKIGGDPSTVITIGDDQIKALQAHSDLKGLGKTKHQMIAEYIATHVLPAVMHPTHVTGLKIEHYSGDPATDKKLEDFLNLYFEVGTAKSAPAEPIVIPQTKVAK